MSSGSGSGADQHLLALLRAIRLRQAAPDAVAAGVADTAAALTDPRTVAGTDEGGERPALPAAEIHEALPPGPQGADAPTAQTPRPAWARPTPGDVDSDAEFAGPDAVVASPGGPDAVVAPHGGPVAGADAADGPQVGVDRAGAGSTAGAVPAVADHFGSAATADFFGRPGPSGTAPAGKGAAHPGPSADTAGSPVPPGPDSSAAAPAPGSGAPGPGRPGAARTVSPFDHGPQLRPPGLPRPDVATPPDPATPLDRAIPLDPSAPPDPATPLDRAIPLDPSAPLDRAAPLDPGAQPRPSEQEPTEDRSREAAAGARTQPPPAATGRVPVPPSRVPGLVLSATGVPHWVPGIETPAVAAPGRAGAATDGMDPADDALLRDTQRLLSTSLTFAGGPVEVAQRLRVALLQAQPTLLAALPGGPTTQVETLALGLTWLVHHLDRPPLVVAGCGRLGAALAACGVAPQRLRFIGAALAEAMRAGMPAGTWRQDFDLAWRSTWQHAYEWMVHGETAGAEQPPTWSAAVVGHELRRPDLAVLRLRPYLPMPVRPGQYARIEVPGLPGVWRPYSLAGRPHRDDVVEVHVRAKTRDGVSGALVHRTTVGDQVRLARAEGGMVLPPPPGPDLLMIGGDTGVAPLKALLAELVDTGDPRSAVLFWGVRNLEELYDITDITDIARSAHRTTVVPVVSEGNPGPYASGLVTDAVAAYGQWARREVYLAGPPPMVAATAAALRQLGVDPARIHHDPPE